MCPVRCALTKKHTGIASLCLDVMKFASVKAVVDIYSYRYCIPHMQSRGIPRSYLGDAHVSLCLAGSEPTCFELYYVLTE